MKKLKFGEERLCNSSERQSGHLIPGCLTSKSGLFQLRDGAEIVLKGTMTEATLGLRKPWKLSCQPPLGKDKKLC